MAEFLVTLRPARPNFPATATETELAVVGEHFAYLQGLLAVGKLRHAGRTQVESPLGLVLLEAENLDEARALLAADPAVSGGVFVGEVFPYRTALREGPAQKPSILSSWNASD